ncbi:MAG: TIGR00266 family protein [Actinobacteria bacterium]|nr:TIGR00266 family protein [Actinomycetota bacterium]MBS1883125.1 TIGR00266 family protein [Actinomycetota bacterium]
MDVAIRDSPSFAVARCTLAPGEQLKAEAGAMMAHSVGVELEAKVQGGLMKGLKRSILGGESLFMTTWTAPESGGWVDVAANLPGDLSVLEVDGDMNVTQGGWLASSIEIELDTKWGGFKNVFGDEGGFLVRCSGSGKIVVACYGAIEEILLGAGEQIVLDSGHLVAFDPTVEFITRKATKGIIQTVKSGEGFVMEFTGPGRILSQSRNPQGLIGWLTQELPFSRES